MHAPRGDGPPPSAADHWNRRYDEVGAQNVSWYQETPEVSLRLLDALGVDPTASVIDVGGGASTLVDHLTARGFVDLTVLDLSASALDAARSRVGAAAPVTWVQADLLSWTPDRTWDVWHDRAVLHFLRSEEERSRYVDLLGRAVRPGGVVVIGVFAEDGPEACSGLPVRRSSADELRELLRGRVEVAVELRQEHVTPSGGVQPFNWVAGRVRG